MSLIEKIDAEIKELRRIGRELDTAQSLENARLITQGMEYAKQIILSEQKEPCEGCVHKEKTIEQYPCRMCPRIYTDKFTPTNHTQNDTVTVD